MGNNTFENLRADYRRLWDKAVVTKTAEAMQQAQLINSHRAIYQDIGQVVGIPWSAIAVLHLREAGEDDVGRWLCVLHNGEKIIGTGRRTSLVPAGRGPFATFKAAAIDAFEIKRLKDRPEWSEFPIEFLAYVSEKFNGFGYRSRNIPTPYSWAGTSVQRPGKFIADHKFDENFMDPQMGTMAVLKSLQQLDPSIGVVTPRTSPFKETAAAPLTTQAAPVLDLAHLVVAALERKGYEVDRGPGELNIIYVEGMNRDGTPNNDEANKWNDLRLLIRFEGGQPRIVGKWAATTEPGRYWTENPLSPLGAARIAFGQYTSWQVGMHHAGKPSGHEALVQTGGLVTVCRDLNKDGVRTGDSCQTGQFGINQHWGYDLAEVDKASAGCLVGQSKDGHREFMALVKSDPRYQANRKHVFATAILPESDVLAEGMAAIPLPIEPVGSGSPVLTDVSDDVRRWQKLLGFSEEEQDGIFGAFTEEAVKRFQRRHGVTVTGEFDENTRSLLEREAAAIGADASTILKAREPLKQPGVFRRFEAAVSPGGTGPIEPAARPIRPDLRNLFPNLVTGDATMLSPLIAVAVGVLPEILKAFVGDKAGTVAGAVSQAVAQVAQTTDPARAREKLNADPEAVAELQFKLAEIAAAQDEKRQQAQLALLKEQNEQEARRQQAQIAMLKDQYEQEAKKREAQLEQFRAAIEDTKSARATFSALALENSPMAWGAPVVSVIVTLGFFGILIVLVTRGMAEGNQVAQIVNITVGALAAAFATVVSFWLGSSQGSRAKDASTTAAIETQARQTETLQSTLQAQAKQAEALQSTVRTAIAATPAKGPKPSNFRRCIDVVLANQSASSGDPGDPNAIAQFGVTTDTLRSWRHDERITAADVRKLDRDEACEIYRTRYWNVLRCDDLPVGVDLVVFDFGVNAGPGLSAKTLQHVVGAAPDGSIGDATLAATKVMPARDVVKDMSNYRLDYYRDLPNGNLLRDRAAGVEKIALEMIEAERTTAA
jgi:lysozyme family protein